MIDLRPGDLVLCNTKGIVPRAIRFAERRRYGKNSPEDRFNHTAIVIDPLGILIETNPPKVRKNVIDFYNNFKVVRPPYENYFLKDQNGIYYKTSSAHKAVDYLNSRLEVGEKYGWVNILSIALSWLTETTLRFGLKDEDICSGLSSLAIEFAGVDLGDDIAWNSPADLQHVAIIQKWEVIYDSQNTA